MEHWTVLAAIFFVVILIVAWAISEDLRRLLRRRRDARMIRNVRTPL